MTIEQRPEQLEEANDRYRSQLSCSSFYLGIPLKFPVPQPQ